MKQYWYKIFAMLHLGFIIIVCTTSAYNSYCEFYDCKKNNLFINTISKVLSPNCMKIYGEVSGCDRGYGLFAPNVRSSGLIFLENNNRKYFPKFSSAEAYLRFSAFETSISDYLLESKKNGTGTSTDSLKKLYYNLLYKCISVKLFNENHCSNTESSIFYSLYEYPSLKDFREKTQDPKLIKLFELQTSLTY